MNTIMRTREFKKHIAENVEFIRKRIKTERSQSEKRIRDYDYDGGNYHAGLADGLQESVEILEAILNL